MQKLFSFLLVTITSTQLFSQAGSGKQSIATGLNDDVAQLSSLNHQFIRDFLTNDTVAHNKIVYKDFVCITANGSVVNRHDYMKGWAHGYDTSVYRSFAMQDEVIRVFGNTALVRAETTCTFVKDGKELNGITVYTDTYIKLDGRWWCIQAQLTPKK